MENYELEARYDSRKSFYGKAHVLANPDKPESKDENTHVLTSYSTIVAWIKADGTAVVKGLYSNTTTRHIKEFLLQNGFKAESSKQIMADYGVKE